MLLDMALLSTAIPPAETTLGCLPVCILHIFVAEVISTGRAKAQGIAPALVSCSCQDLYRLWIWICCRYLDTDHVGRAPGKKQLPEML